MEVPELARLVRLDDTVLLEWRREARAEIDRNPSPELLAVYDATTQEITSRATEAWAKR